MAAPKIIWEPKTKENNLRDKQIVESLIERLNNKIQNDPKVIKKAADILAQWLNEKTRP